MSSCLMGIYQDELILDTDKKIYNHEISNFKLTI